VLTVADYKGAKPFLHTNLSGRDHGILMRRAEEDIYQAEVEGILRGKAFWVTVSASTQRYDHLTLSKRTGGSIFVNVTE